MTYAWCLDSISRANLSRSLVSATKNFAAIYSTFQNRQLKRLAARRLLSASNFGSRSSAFLLPAESSQRSAEPSVSSVYVMSGWKCYNWWVINTLVFLRRALAEDSLRAKCVIEVFPGRKPRNKSEFFTEYRIALLASAQSSDFSQPWRSLCQNQRMGSHHTHCVGLGFSATKLRSFWSRALAGYYLSNPEFFVYLEIAPQYVNFQNWLLRYNAL